MSTQSQPLSAFDRVQRAMGSNTPHVCDKCGSTHFTEVKYQQYAQGRYSSAPGGDILPMGEMPLEILVCVCGYPKLPNIGGVRGGRTAPEEVRRFLESLEMAHKVLGARVSANQLGDAIAKASQGFVLKQEEGGIVSQLAALREAQDALLARMTFLEAPLKPADPKAAEKPKAGK